MLRPSIRVSAVIAAFVSSCVAFAQAATTIEIKPDRESGVYDPGQTVTWQILVTKDKQPLSGKASYRVLLGGADEIGKGEVELADGKAAVTGTRADAGCLLLQFKYKAAGEEKETTAHGGAVFAPDKIAVSAPPPDDFDTFWKEKIAALNAIPINAQLTPGESGAEGIEYFKVTFDNIGGAKIQGQLAKPAGKSELPAMLQVQYAGVYALHKNWVVDQAKQGWLALNIIAHDLPIDEKPEFYKEKAEKELNDYPGIGNDDREKSYFLKMFLSCYRAADYLTQRPEWNKKSLLVHGGSQGGYQAIVTAGMHPAVTAFAANVPAGCDHTGKQAKRAPGWPNWASRTWQKKDYNKMLETSRYFDAMNFAHRIKVPGLIGIGLVDLTCPPEGIFATCNVMKGEKKIIIMPRSGHGGEGPGHGAYYGAMWQFFQAQRK